jgi:serine/threonine-protein kinase
MNTNDPLIGRRLSNFRLERVIGRGGMATVYYGWDMKLERPVAIKLIDTRHRDDPSYARRFVNEARAVASWFHPNILQVHFADDEDGLYYFVMEYIQGLDLGELLAQYRQDQELMPQDDVIRIGRAVANALDYAHERGVVHRDVKPTNVMVSEDGRVVLADFGLAMDVALGTVGRVFGSPHYISPEQARDSSEALPQSDIYSLGVMLYEMLTGSVPFDDPSPTSIAIQHLTLEVPSPLKLNPNLNPVVEEVLLKVLSKSPQERYRSAQQFMDALENALLGADSPQATLPEQSPVKMIPDLSPMRPLSRLSVNQRVADNVKKEISHQPEPSQRMWLSRLVQKPFPWWATGLGILFSLIVFVGIILIAIGKFAPGITPTPVSLVLQGKTPSPTSSLTESLPVQEGITKSPTIEIQPANTIEPTLSVTVELSPTPEPTDKILVSSTPSNPTQTSSPLSPTETPGTTNPPKPPEGDYFVLFYDETGLYFENLSGKDRSVYPITFERLDTDGNPLNRFEGWYWGEIYPNFRAGYCMVLEIINTVNHLNPLECQGRHLVYRTPTSDDPYIFWTNQQGSRQFRVLWDDDEVARCKIAKGFCEVYSP